MNSLLKECTPIRIAIGALVIALSLPAIALTNQQQGLEKSSSNQNVSLDRDDDDDDKNDKKNKGKKKLEREQNKKQENEQSSKGKRDDDDDDDDKYKERKKAKDSDKEDDDDDDDEDKDDEDADKDKDDDDDEDDDKDKDDDDDEDDDKDKDDDDDEDDDKDKSADDEDKADNKLNSETVTVFADARSETTSPEPAAPISPEAALSVTATIETAPVPSTGDAADDAAIWVNPKDPTQSTIIGSNKQGGLAVYALDGKQLQYLPDGLMNNVDLRSGFSLAGQEVTIVAAGNRGDNSIAIYRVNQSTRMLENVAARKITTISAYGSCLYRSRKTGKFFYIVTSKSGEVEQWELSDNGRGKVDAKSMRRFKVGTQLEGCVADDELGHLYIGEEAVGIWKYSAEVDSGDDRVLVDKAGADGHLVADVEGLTIAYGKDGTGYLVASSQGNNSFVVYTREENNAYIKTFSITASNGIDGVEDTDGIDVTMANLGPAFPQGVFVAQDGLNDKGNQNFKLVPLQSIISVK